MSRQVETGAGKKRFFIGNFRRRENYLGVHAFTEYMPHAVLRHACAATKALT
jgi:hypothetical protein